MEHFRELLEAKHKDGEIQTKDWDRMMDLELAGKDGAGTARAIKDKNKAMARYVAGIKLEGRTKNIESWSEFGAFKEKAIELGATEQEITDMINITVVPPKTATKYASLKTKNLDNRFVGVISKAVLKMGFDISFSKSGDAITWAGKDAMNNGRKWTIGYRTEITTSNEKLSFVFDAITDESVDTKPTYYVVDELKNLSTGTYHNGSDHAEGQRAFLAWLKEELSQYK